MRASDKVFVMPLEDPASVTRLERNGVPVRGARAGDNAEITLSGVDAARVVVGNVLCKAGGTVPVVQRFSAQIVALPALEVGGCVSGRDIRRLIRGRALGVGVYRCFVCWTQH